MSESARKVSSQVKSARRVLEIFEYFAERRSSATVGEISKALGYPQSSTSVLLQCLSEMRYIHYDACTRTYRPTLRFALTGTWIRDTRFTGADLTELMIEIQQQVPAEIVVGIRAGVDVQYIQRIPSKLSPPFHMPLGILRPMARTATGKVLLSLMDDTEASAVLRHINSRVEAPERVVPSEILAELSEIRETGISMTVNGATADAACIAIALANGPDCVPMTLGVGGPTSFILENEAKIRSVLLAVTGKAQQQQPDRVSRNLELSS